VARCRRGALAAIALAFLPGPAAARACAPVAPPDPRIPTWQQVTGTALGAQEASDEQLDTYLAAVDRASDRVRVASAGRSLGGRPLLYAVVGDPGAIAPRRLAAAAARMRALRSGRLGPRAVARVVRDGRAFAWIAGGVHGNEPSGADADARLLYALASGRDCATARRLARLVVLILPVQNPDGRAARTHVNADGFDLNRDWFARTQPETAAKVALLDRYPPLVFADQHESDGGSFFFPPNADPVHHEISAQALHAIDHVFAPALRHAFDARGIPHFSGATYDLFFMGYGDTAPTTLFGAAGMTFEKGSDAPYATRVDEHFLAADTVVGAAARHERSLLAGWARQWPEARAQGARARLQPNRVVVAGARVHFPVPAGRVAAYAIRTDRHAADAAALGARLAGVGVAVQRLRRAVPVRGFRAYGGAPAGPVTLPAGTLYVPMRQGAKHWVEAMLAPDPYVAVPYFYDVSSWSNPLLMGLSGGLLTTPLAARVLEPARPDAPPPAPATPAAAYGFDGGSLGAAALACALLAQGASVSRDPSGGGYVVAGGTDLGRVRALAAADRVPVRPLGAPPAGAVGLRLPKVALVGADDASRSWARALLRRRLGLPADELGDADLTAGRLTADGYTAVVVPDGHGLSLSETALLALRAWVRGGGTLVAWRGQGIAVARAAGVTTVGVRPADPALQIPGASLRVLLDPADPVAWGEEPDGFVFDTGDPVLDPGSARVVARHPSDQRFFVSGYTSGADTLRGTTVATDETAGAGRVVLFAFDAAFRGYVEGTERLVANALLAPSPGALLRGAPAGGRSPRRPVDPAALAATAVPRRAATVTVAAGDEDALLSAARAAGVPRRARLERDLTTVSLRIPNARGLADAPPAWALSLPRRLALAGVRPLLAIL
jgi:hypothetical protein